MHLINSAGFFSYIYRKRGDDNSGFCITIMLYLGELLDSWILVVCLWNYFHHPQGCVQCYHVFVLFPGGLLELGGVTVLMVKYCYLTII